MAHIPKKEMIDIAPDKEKIIRSLQELEFEYSQKNISRKAYLSQKKDLNEQLDTLDVASRIRKLQGKGQAEKPLDYWTEQEEKKKVLAEQEELFKRYINDPKPKGKLASVTSGRRKTILALFLVVAFFVGTGFGALIMQGPNTSSASLLVNESAFPVKNTTNTTNTTNVTRNVTVVKKTNTTKVTTTPTTPVTPTPPTNGT